MGSKVSSELAPETRALRAYHENERKKKVIERPGYHIAKGAPRAPKTTSRKNKTRSEGIRQHRDYERKSPTPPSAILSYIPLSISNSSLSSRTSFAFGSSFTTALFLIFLA